MTRNGTTWPQLGPYLALVVALTATLGSLYYSEIAGFIPCTLCWYQRILMYPLSVILFIAILKQDIDVIDYVLPFSIVGMGVASYHYLLQLGVIPYTGVCTVGVPCNLRYVNYFGFVTIPLMALTAFTIITGVLALAKWAGRGAAAEKAAS